MRSDQLKAKRSVLVQPNSECAELVHAIARNSPIQSPRWQIGAAAKVMAPYCIYNDSALRLLNNKMQKMDREAQARAGSSNEYAAKLGFFERGASTREEY